MPQNKPIVITMGDPAGIGGEITLKSLDILNEKQQYRHPFVVLDCPIRLQKLALKLQISSKIHIIYHLNQAIPHTINILPLSASCDAQLAKPDKKFAPLIIESIDKAVEYCLKHQAGSMITAPIAKNILMDGGFSFAGHTEYLAHLTQDKQALMLLINKKMAVLPLSVHIALRHVASEINQDMIVNKILLLHHEIQRKLPQLAKKPLAILGLNPHAGESGKLGTEEITIINPAIQILRQHQINISDPMPADTAFSPENIKKYAVFVGFYHDQVLTPIKMQDMHGTVNMTLGLKINRVSPDHGTAFDIADKFIANPNSMLNALYWAVKLAQI